jgi:hypothetical protein
VRISSDTLAKVHQMDGMGLKHPSPTWSYNVHFVKSLHWIWECLNFHWFCRQCFKRVLRKFRKWNLTGHLCHHSLINNESPKLNTIRLVIRFWAILNNFYIIYIYVTIFSGAVTASAFKLVTNSSWLTENGVNGAHGPIVPEHVEPV